MSRKEGLVSPTSSWLPAAAHRLQRLADQAATSPTAGHQGLGLGGKLMHLAIETARRESLGFLWLGVWERNESAIAMYRHRGFRVFGDHVFMFGGDAQTDLLMRLDLE